MSTKILLIDDDKTFDDMYVKKFTDSGFKIAVITAPNEDIVHQVRKTAPDLIIMDLMFATSPYNGADLAKMLQGDEHTEFIPIIYLTNAQIGHIAEEAKHLPSTIGFYIKANAIPSETVRHVSELYAEFQKKQQK